jgi:CheY-like chemotaxis protein
MHTIRLIHWNADEARERAKLIRGAGYRVQHEVPRGPESLRELRTRPPAAIVIDLTRLPSHGREVALAVRYTKSTRHIPLVFVAGAPEKVARVKRVLPDAVYAPWSRIRSALRSAIAHPPAKPRVPSSVLEGYSGTPLPKKLGIQPDSEVALVGAPGDFHKTLSNLPPGASLRNARAPRGELTLWFARSRKEFERRIRKFAAALGDGRMWIAWPKQASGMKSDLSDRVIRGPALAAGLVDYKVCAIDATWSGLLFRHRQPKKK